MVSRIDWLNNGIDRMLAGKSPLTPEEWGVRDSVRARDVDLLRMAAQLNSLRSGASAPSSTFLANLRARMLEEAD
jgi:hypothetical protein